LICAKSASLRQWVRAVEAPRRRSRALQSCDGSRLHFSNQPMSLIEGVATLFG